MKTKMKGIAVLFLLFIAAVACKKDYSETNKKTFKTSDIFEFFVMPDDLNAEAQRIVDDISDNDFSFGISDNPNFGLFSNNPEYDIILSGKSQEGLTIKLNGDEYTSNGNGQWLEQNIDFKQYFDTDVEVELIWNGISNIETVHVPKPLLALKLSAPESQNIGRTGNTLTWETDPNNECEKVALVYHLFRPSSTSEGEEIFDGDLLLLDDNGSFNIDGLIGDECTKIYFKLVRGNTVSAVLNGKKVLFQIASFDHHEYLID